MPIVVLLLLLAATIFSAAQLQDQGHPWADEVCFSTYGLCNRPFLLGLIVGLVSSMYFVHSVVSDKSKRQ